MVAVNGTYFMHKDSFNFCSKIFFRCLRKECVFSVQNNLLTSFTKLIKMLFFHFKFLRGKYCMQSATEKFKNI